MSKADDFKWWMSERTGHPHQLKVALEVVLEHEARIAELENQWISVEDRLPDEFGDYLVYGEGFMGSDYWNGNTDEFAFRNDATHWMPLPSPPPKEKQR